MKIVIEIPDEYYEIIQNQSQYIEEVGMILQDAAYNGIVLPKNHGEIVDLSDIEATACGNNEVILEATRIIEADKAESEE